MSTRNRTTWAAAAAGRKASAPPAVPGYNTEDQDHPAHQPDPAYDKYKKGDPDAWAETPKAPPYPEGNPPQVPGYDTEDQDHPAHIKNPRVPKEAKIQAMIERKAAKCLHLATSILGKTASKQAVEMHALGLMDAPETRINAALKRLGGGFLAQDFDGFDDFGGFDDMNPVMMDDDPFEDSLFAEEPVVPVEEPTSELAGIRAELNELKALMRAASKRGGEIPPQFLENAQKKKDEAEDDKKDDKGAGKKKADQNDPKGKTLAPTAKTEEQVRSEAAATANGEQKSASVKLAKQMFASMDTDRDGFVAAEDWTGNKAVFQACDMDGDGILSEDDFTSMFSATEPFGAYASLDENEMAMLSAMNRQAEDDKEDKLPAFLKKDDDKEDKKAGEEEDDEDDKAAGKKAKSSILAQIKALLKQAEEADDDEDDSETAAKKAGEEEDDDDKEAAKKAAKRLAQLRAKRKAAEEEEEGSAPEEDDDSETAGKKAGEEEDDEIQMEEDEESDKEAASFFSGDGDPMGLGGEVSLTAEESQVLASIFNQDLPGVEASSLPGDSVRQASLGLKPKPRLASTGVRSVGNLSRQASSIDNDLSKLWASAPDVSEVFGLKKQD